MSECSIYLVPGFFGFVNFGNLVYFSHVTEFLGAELQARGVSAKFHSAPVPPTASIVQRSTELFDFIIETAPKDESLIHVIGHSTGGLDARLLVTPNVKLNGRDSEAIDRIAARVGSVTTLATPHLGTPLASFFNGLLGQRLLAILSAATVTILREGQLPLGISAKIAAGLARTRLPGGKTAEFLDHLHEELIGVLPDDQASSVGEFLRDVAGDTTLIPQLTPAGMDLFGAGTGERDSVRYGCAVTCAARPSFRHRWHMGLQMGDHASYAMFAWLHGQSEFERGFNTPQISARQRRAVVRGLGKMPNYRDSDGVVPTLSQVHGEVLHAATADHLDVIGHFDEPNHKPPHRDWLRSDSRFQRHDFEALWRDVAEFVARGA